MNADKNRKESRAEVEVKNNDSFLVFSAPLRLCENRFFASAGAARSEGISVI
jgi:hypothetical protein